MSSKPETKSLPPMIRVIGFSTEGLVLHVGGEEYTAAEVTAVTDFLMETINRYLTERVAKYRAEKAAKAEAALPADESTATPDAAAEAAANEWLAQFMAAGGRPN